MTVDGFFAEYTQQPLMSRGADYFACGDLRYHLRIDTHHHDRNGLIGGLNRKQHQGRFGVDVGIYGNVIY
jgi:hypothetical protein